MAIMDTNPESHQYQYIQDTSLASLDSKTSPLAMLVRTCSQIGADPPVAAAAKSKKQSAAASAPATVADRPHSASPAAAVATAYPSHAVVKHHRNHNNNYVEEPPKPAKLNFKPYENTVLTLSPHHHNNNNNNNNNNKNNNNNNNNSHRRPNDDDVRPKSSGSEDNNNGHGDGKKRKSASPRDDYATAHHRGTSKSSRRSSSSSASASSETAAAASAAAAADPSADNNPIIRSGLEVMHGAAAKAFCPPPMPMAAHSPYKPDALAAFRHTYLPGAPWMPMASARPPSSSPGECKDPLCGGPAAGCGQQQQQQQHAAAFAFASQYHPMMAGGCPAGCAQCDHQRYLTSLMAAATVPAFYAPVARPYTCSWVIPGGGGGGGHRPPSAGAEAAAVPSLCGKSFGTSDELLQHIRTHTSGAGGVTAAAMHAAGAGPMSPTTAAALSAYNGHLSRHLFHHPSAVAAAAAAAAAAYGKLPSMMSPYSAFNPTAAYCYLPPPPPPPQQQQQQPQSQPQPTASAAGYHHHHPLYSPRGDTSAATVSR